MSDENETKPDPTTETTTGGRTTPDSLVGSRIGHYHVLSLLGRGGFGAVYKARDSKLDRLVALKFLRYPLEPRHMELFEREAKAIAALSKHPGIVQIHAWGSHQGLCYFVLEFVENNAEKTLQESPEGLPLIPALRITAECAEALGFAHQQGFLHRDIKPANILIEPAYGQAKIADFGLARFRPSVGASTSGEISGSPPYMSPEQASGEHVDERSDIFSLSATLYELLSGKRPFEGTSTDEVLERVRQYQRVPLQQHRPDLPRAVLEIVEKAMAFKPEDRYQTAKEFAVRLRKTVDALERSGSATVAAAPAPRRGSSRRIAVAGIALLAVVAAGIAGQLLARYWASQSGRVSQTGIPALAEAKEKLEQGDLTAAASSYKQYLAEHPNEDEARYGLGYALLRQGSIQEAQTEFTQVTDNSRKTEGHAAVAFERDGEAARSVVDSASKVVDTAYPDVLVASLDVGAEKYQEAVKRLATIEGRPFHFDWQRVQGRQTLGQAYFRLGDYANAKRVFDVLAASESPATAAMASAYVGLAQQQLDEARRQQTREQIARLKELKQQYQEPSNEDSWTSRPIRVWVYRALPGKSRLALESGLVDVLPWMLANDLKQNSATPLEVVNRELLPEMLAEQELSAELSSGTDRLRLGRVLGARVLVECRFDSLMQKDYAMVAAMDTETTSVIPVNRIDLPHNFDPETWVKRLGETIAQAVARAYPVRGRLTAGESGPQLNIGRAVGVREGMRFRVAVEPDEGTALPDKWVVIGQPAGETDVLVQVEGFEAKDVPPGGWYVFAERTGAQ